MHFFKDYVLFIKIITNNRMIYLPLDPSVKTKFSKILKAVGSSFWRGTDIIGYAFLLPILGEFAKFLQSYNVSDIDFDTIAKSLSEATGIIVGGHVLKRMFNSLSEKYKN